MEACRKMNSRARAGRALLCAAMLVFAVVLGCGTDETAPPAPTDAPVDEPHDAREPETTSDAATDAAADETLGPDVQVPDVQVPQADEDGLQTLDFPLTEPVETGEEQSEQEAAGHVRSLLQSAIENEAESEVVPIVPAEEPEELDIEEVGELDSQDDELGEKLTDEEINFYSTKPFELGPPLVDDADKLINTDPAKKAPVWKTPDNKSVVFQGVVCQRETPLEMFVCRRGTTEHESVISADLRPFLIHAALLGVGAEQGTAVQFYPEYRPATGQRIDVTVIWKDEDGKVQKRKAQEWVRNAADGKQMDQHWVFAGSGMSSGEDLHPDMSPYHADRSGNIITIANFPDAMLDLPAESSASDVARLYECFTERIPERGTPVTVVLTPVKEEKESSNE